MAGMPGGAVDEGWRPGADPGLAALVLARSPAMVYLAGLPAGAPVDFLSPAARRWLGAAARRLAGGAAWVDLVHPDDRLAYRTALETMAAAGRASVDYRLDRDGSWAWMRDELVAVAEAGAEARVLGHLHDIADERAADARLADASRMMAAMIRSALDAVVTMDENGRVIEFNPAAEHMFGHSRAEAVGHSLAELIIPEAYRAGHAAGLDRFRRTGRTALPNRRLLVEARRRDGTTFPVELTIAHAALGDRSIFIGEIRDVSERVEAHAERARLNRLLKDAVDSLAVGFCIVGPDGRIRLCNEAFARLYERPAEALIGRPRLETAAQLLGRLKMFDGAPVEGGPDDAARIAARITAPGPTPIEIGLDDGSWAMIWSTPTSDGGMVVVRTDVTRMKKAEQAVRESAELVRRILESCPVPIGMTRASDSKVIYESPASRALFGRDPGQGPVYGRAGFVDPADRDRYLAALRARGSLDGYEVRMRRHDGTAFRAALSARLTEFEGEEVIVSSSFDLTERYAVEAELGRQREALHQSEKMAALGELLAGIAHELNNPLSVVVGQALLLKETARDRDTIERTARLARAADRCVRIVRSFLSMARSRPRRSEAVDLADIVRAALDLTGHALRGSGVRLRVEIPDTVPSVVGDPDLLVQVMTNLVFNAEAALRTVDGQRSLSIAVAPDGAGAVSVTVRDSGPGVPRALRRRIFEPFFTTGGAEGSPGAGPGAGTGIGLAFCRRVVESHGGTIRLVSPRGGGAAFVVTLPTGGPAIAPAGADAAGDRLAVPSAAAQAGRRILVVDDETDVADTLAAMLQADDHEVTVARSGLEALARLRAMTFDAILSDLRMPDLDGEQLHARLLAENPAQAACLAFLAGDTMSPEASRFLAACGRPHLQKPITLGDLRGLLETLFAAASLRTPRRRRRPLRSDRQ